MQTIAAASSGDHVPRALASRLARDAEDLPETDRELRRRFPDEPYRQRFGFIAERLRRTRAALVGEPAPRTGRYATAADLETELTEIADALVAEGLERVAWGEVAELRWQVGTFGFHLAELEVRQHSAVHTAALTAIRDGRPPETEVSAGVTVGEVLATFRAIADAQARFGVEACHRYVVSFTGRRVGRHRRPRARPDRRVGRHRRRQSRDRRAGPRCRAAVRVERGARRRRFDPRGAPRRSGLPRDARRAGRSTGGDARLLRFEQGVRIPRGGVDAPPGAGRARRDGPVAWRRADAVPRARRCDRARRRADQQGDPRAGARAPSMVASSSRNRARSSPRTTPTRRSPAVTSSR